MLPAQRLHEAADREFQRGRLVFAHPLPCLLKLGGLHWPAVGEAPLLDAVRLGAKARPVALLLHAKLREGRVRMRSIEQRRALGASRIDVGAGDDDARPLRGLVDTKSELRVLGPSSELLEVVEDGRLVVALAKAQRLEESRPVAVDVDDGDRVGAEHARPVTVARDDVVLVDLEDDLLADIDGVVLARDLAGDLALDPTRALDGVLAALLD